MMNKWNMLLRALDEVFGYEGKNQSSFKAINKYFKQETGETVVVIEYKTKKKGEIVIKKGRGAPIQQSLGLLQNLLGQKKTKSK